MLNEALKTVAVVGAGGKMGSGIALLLLQEMARLEAELTGAVGTGGYRLYLIDANPDALGHLLPYLRAQLTRYAERNIVALRQYYAEDVKKVSNQDIVQAFVEGALDTVRCETENAKAAHANLVFEAIAEEIEAKVGLFQTIASHAKSPPYYFTNTSSIPIHVLNDRAKLESRIIGFHFYNPPAIQKLVELVIPSQTNPQLISLAQVLGKRLDKQLVTAHDVAGFIGNGHFIREIMFACEKVHELSREYALTEAIALINKVTQDFLIRPMGIFQLIDYVGIDICQSIGGIMNRFLPGDLFQDGLLDEMITEDRRGGHEPNGDQKNGFFSYERANRKIYSLKEQSYIPIPDCDKILGPFPKEHASWKHLQHDPHREIKLEYYFQNLYQSNSVGAQLAQEFLQNSRHIANELVESGVAQTLEDVDTVLKLGFYHLYGPHTFWESDVKS
jgi:3-hydroxyacyl-CoA dehydrogenase